MKWRKRIALKVGKRELEMDNPEMGTGGWWASTPSWTLNWPPIIKILNGFWWGCPHKNFKLGQQNFKNCRKIRHKFVKRKNFYPPPSNRTLAHLWDNHIVLQTKVSWTPQNQQQLLSLPCVALQVKSTHTFRNFRLLIVCLFVCLFVCLVYTQSPRGTSCHLIDLKFTTKIYLFRKRNAFEASLCGHFVRFIEIRWHRDKNYCQT